MDWDYARLYYDQIERTWVANGSDESAPTHMDAMRRMGEFGWELVGVGDGPRCDSEGVSSSFYFKRPLEQRVLLQ